MITFDKRLIRQLLNILAHLVGDAFALPLNVAVFEDSGNLGKVAVYKLCTAVSYNDAAVIRETHDFDFFCHNYSTIDITSSSAFMMPSSSILITSSSASS